MSRIFAQLVFEVRMVDLYALGQVLPLVEEPFIDFGPKESPNLLTALASKLTIDWALKVLKKDLKVFPLFPGHAILWPFHLCGNGSYEDTLFL